MVNNQTDIGHINLKEGNTRHITQFIGHIGYEVWPEYRGNADAYHACIALKPYELACRDAYGKRRINNLLKQP